MVNLMPTKLVGTKLGTKTSQWRTGGLYLIGNGNNGGFDESTVGW